MKHVFKKIFLVILDGFGLAPSGKSNPISLAKMPFLNSLLSKYPSFNIMASGLVVGLPWGKPGNSEVGHSAIGAGRVIVQDWARINEDIQKGAFFENPAFISASEHVKKYNSQLHIIGCTSPGGIHAHEDHAIALLEFSARQRLPHVFLHMITDGEDTGPVESLATLQRLKNPMEKANVLIATVMGRVYGMDRVLNWELTKQTWEAIVEGNGKSIANVAEYLAQLHNKKIFDDQIPPANVKDTAVINDSDAVIFFNYRNDRIKQLVMSFIAPDFKAFERKKIPKNLFIATMTKYTSSYGHALPVNAVAYEAPEIHHTLGKEISRRLLKQFRAAEKEKEAHITSFFDGGRIDPYDGAELVIVSSRPMRGREYAEHPEMSTKKITEELLSRADDDFTFYLINLANSDMMAHSGDIYATIEGLKVIDSALKEIANKVLSDPNSALAITCDHGNAEELIDPATGGPDTRHSTNNVFAVFAGDGLEHPNDNSLEKLTGEDSSGSLIDIAPTILHLLEFEKPKEMTGISLI